jgi:hypothetical protein
MSENYRLFLVPGMQYCGNGQGTDSFGRPGQSDDSAGGTGQPIRVSDMYWRYCGLQYSLPDPVSSAENVHGSISMVLWSFLSQMEYSLYI